MRLSIRCYGKSVQQSCDLSKLQDGWQTKRVHCLNLSLAKGQLCLYNVQAQASYNRDQNKESVVMTALRGVTSAAVRRRDIRNNGYWLIKMLVNKTVFFSNRWIVTVTHCVSHLRFLCSIR